MTRNCCNGRFTISVLFPWQKQRWVQRPAQLGADWQPHTPRSAIQEGIFSASLLLSSKHKMIADYTLALSGEEINQTSSRARATDIPHAPVCRALQSLAKWAVPPSTNTHLDARRWAIEDRASRRALRWSISRLLMAPQWLQTLRSARSQTTSLSPALINTNTQVQS